MDFVPVTTEQKEEMLNSSIADVKRSNTILKTKENTIKDLERKIESQSQPVQISGILDTESC